VLWATAAAELFADCGAKLKTNHAMALTVQKVFCCPLWGFYHK
jgi:hypothetical protein